MRSAELLDLAEKLLDELNEYERSGGVHVREEVLMSSEYVSAVDWDLSRTSHRRPSTRWVLVLRGQSTAVVLVGEPNRAWRLGDAEDLDEPSRREVAFEVADHALATSSSLTFNRGVEVLDAAGRPVGHIRGPRSLAAMTSPMWEIETASGRTLLRVRTGPVRSRFAMLVFREDFLVEDADGTQLGVIRYALRTGGRKATLEVDGCDVDALERAHGEWVVLGADGSSAATIGYLPRRKLRVSPAARWELRSLVLACVVPLNVVIDRRPPGGGG
jgi:hypothetical protein